MVWLLFEVTDLGVSPLLRCTVDHLAFFYSNGDLLYGFATIGVTLLPSIAALMRKRHLWAAFHHLPFVHILMKFQRCNEKRDLRDKTQYCRNLIQKSEKSKEKAIPRILVDQYKQELSNFKLVSQVDSGYHSILESGSMYVLQSCIVFKQHGYFGILGWKQVSNTQSQALFSSLFRYILKNLSKP